MSAGMSAQREATRSQLRIAEYRRRLYAEQRKLHGYREATRSERSVAARLAALESWGWKVLADRRWPGSRTANVDMIAVGPGGVLVIDVKAWREFSVVDGALYCGQACADDEVDKILRITLLAEEALAELGLAPLEVVPVLVLADRSSIDCRLGRVTLLGEGDVDVFCARRGERLTTDQINMVISTLETAFVPYREPEVSLVTVSEPMPVLPREVLVPDALFDVHALQAAELEAAARGPIEDWMTFLHPDQVRLVRRSWNGPARIRGPAGTGKTVVGLHRAAYLAATRGGPILYTSFVRTLPDVLAQLYRRLAGEAAERVEFTGMHAWSLRLLRSRGVPTRVDGAQVERVFNRAWLAAGAASSLASLSRGPGYWHQEIDYVIKGRGLTDFTDYAQLSRIGRRTPLQPEHREAVWDLYLAYDQLLRRAGINDFNDIIVMALEAVRERPVEPAYTAVVVDEVQDLPCVGIQLLHSLVGDQADALLLIGDGQQAVYPGGFTLAEAGVSVAGRAAILRTNYRNAGEILSVASQAVADHAFDDLDGHLESGRRDVVVARCGGETRRCDATDRMSHDAALLSWLRAAVAHPLVSYGDIAVLAATRGEAQRYGGVLSRHSIPWVGLEDYHGVAVAAVKVGTFKRAKGLEFKHVALPGLRQGPPHRYPGESEDTYRERAELGGRELFVGMTRARDGLWLGYLPATTPRFAGRR